MRKFGTIVTAAAALTAQMVMAQESPKPPSVQKTPVTKVPKKNLIAPSTDVSSLTTVGQELFSVQGAACTLSEPYVRGQKVEDRRSAVVYLKDDKYGKAGNWEIMQNSNDGKHIIHKDHGVVTVKHSGTADKDSSNAIPAISTTHTTGPYSFYHWTRPATEEEVANGEKARVTLTQKCQDFQNTPGALSK